MLASPDSATELPYPSLGLLPASTVPPSHGFVGAPVSLKMYAAPGPELPP